MNLPTTSPVHANTQPYLARSLRPSPLGRHVALLMSLAAAGALAYPTAAAAAEPEAKRAPDGAEKAEAGGEKAEKGEKHEEEEARIRLDLDFVLGFGKVDLVDPASSTPEPQPGPGIDRARTTTYSFIAGAGYEFENGLFLGARLPFSGVSFGDPADRSTNAIGNLEVEGAYETELTESLKLEFALGVALPTAQGTEVPGSPDDINIARGPLDLANYDRGALQRAVAMSRGYEENALFEIDHLGLIPKLALGYHQGAFHFDPYVKVENLIATKSNAEHSYTGELVFGATAAYRVAPHVEPALRVWANVPLANTDFTAVAAAEPQLRFPFHDITPLVGVLLPFAGPLTNPYEVGVRIAIGGRL